MKNKAKAKTTKVRQPSAYDLHLKLFDRILRKTVAGMGGWRKSMEAKPQFVTALAKQCCAAQLPEEEALAIAEGRLDLPSPCINNSLQGSTAGSALIQRASMFLRKKSITSITQKGRTLIVTGFWR